MVGGEEKVLTVVREPQVWRCLDPGVLGEGDQIASLPDRGRFVDENFRGRRPQCVQYFDELVVAEQGRHSFGGVDLLRGGAPLNLLTCLTRGHEQIGCRYGLVFRASIESIELHTHNVRGGYDSFLFGRPNCPAKHATLSVVPSPKFDGELPAATTPGRASRRCPRSGDPGQARPVCGRCR